MMNTIQEDSKDLDTLESQIVHHPVHDRRNFVDSWEFIMLVILFSLLFGFVLGLGLRMVI